MNTVDDAIREMESDLGVMARERVRQLKQQGQVYLSKLENAKQTLDSLISQHRERPYFNGELKTRAMSLQSRLEREIRETRREIRQIRVPPPDPDPSPGPSPHPLPSPTLPRPRRRGSPDDPQTPQTL
jgi:hypothetical protein